MFINENNTINNKKIKNRLEEGGIRKKGLFKESYQDNPVISIVTVVYNGGKHLEQTINSVLNQSYDNIEYIIIDGGSTDNTLDIIKKYDSRIDYWISEPDSGIYNAMNKGSILCHGEYIAFMNSDDWYNDYAVKIIVDTINHYNVDYIAGSVNIYEGNVISRVFAPDIKLYKDEMPIPHPGLFIKKKHLLNNEFDESYKVIADYDLIIKLIKKNLTYTFIDSILANFRVGGISSESNYDKEIFRLTYNHFGLYRATVKYLVKNKKIIAFIKWVIRYN